MDSLRTWKDKVKPTAHQCHRRQIAVPLHGRKRQHATLETLYSQVNRTCRMQDDVLQITAIEQKPTATVSIFVINHQPLQVPFVLTQLLLQPFGTHFHWIGLRAPIIHAMDRSYYANRSHSTDFCSVSTLQQKQYIPSRKLARHRITKIHYNWDPAWAPRGDIDTAAQPQAGLNIVGRRGSVR